MAEEHRNWFTQMMDEEPLAIIGLLILAVTANVAIVGLIFLGIRVLEHMK